MIYHRELTMRRCYNSGPISGLSFLTALKRFDVADKEILLQGYEPVNPMERTWGLRPSAPWWLHMVKDVALLLSCSAIRLQEGWQESRGCRIEERVARWCPWIRIIDK